MKTVGEFVDELRSWCRFAGVPLNRIEIDFRRLQFHLWLDQESIVDFEAALNPAVGFAESLVTEIRRRREASDNSYLR